jgi:hypothetical protein
MGIIFGAVGGVLAVLLVVLLVFCCYCRAKGGCAPKSGNAMSKHNKRYGSTLSERAVLEAERHQLVEQMSAAAAALGGLTPISDPAPPKRKGKRESVVEPVTPSRGGNRFASTPSELVFGRPAEAALGIFHYLHTEETVVNAAIAVGGVEAIVAEVTKHGTEEDLECLEYVLNAEAGSSALTFQGGLRRDCGPDGCLLECRVLKEDFGDLLKPAVLPSPFGVRVGEKAAAPTPPKGMRIDDFVRSPQVKHARLTKAHVVALRLYSTAVRCLPPSLTCPFEALPLASARPFSYQGTRRSAQALLHYPNH